MVAQLTGKNVKYLILGAGPSGLSFANKLIELGEDDLVVLESNEVAGGLCRSEYVDGSPLDIGGGHFLDVRRPVVNEFLFGFMPREEWNKFKRDSRIDLGSCVIGHPFEANIWQLPIPEQVEYLISIADAGCNRGEQMPQRFTDWIRWKLGDRIAERYMLPYNMKMFGDELDCLGTYWLEKLPSVDFRETLLSCLTREAHGLQPGHAEFLYPKEYGYGELWLRMAEALGDRVHYGNRVVGIDFNETTATTASGAVYHADKIVTTIPWSGFAAMEGIPDSIRDSVAGLKHTSVEIDYYPDCIETDAHWMYCPAPELPYHRILVRHNFCPESNGYWTETNTSRSEPQDSLVRFSNSYAYPLNTIDKPEIMRELLDWAEAHCVYGLGRWGEHQHYNSDVCVERALSLAVKLVL